MHAGRSLNHKRFQDDKRKRGSTVLGADDDVAQRCLSMDSMMTEDLAHADVHLEEDGEELRILKRHLKTIEGVTSPIHASEEVEDDVPDGIAVLRKRQGCR